MIGAFVLSAGFYDAYYLKAQKVRALIKQDFDNLFSNGIDAITDSYTPTAAFPLGKKNQMSPLEMYLNDIFTVPTNLAGLPAISVPSGLDSNKLPLGLQLIGRPWEEGFILNLAHIIEESLRPKQKIKEMVGVDLFLVKDSKKCIVLAYP